MKVTRIGLAAPHGSPRRVADELREWADRVERGDVTAVGLVAVHGPECHLYVACNSLTDDGAALTNTLIKCVAGARMLTDIASEHARFAMFEGGSVYTTATD